MGLTSLPLRTSLEHPGQKKPESDQPTSKFPAQEGQPVILVERIGWAPLRRRRAARRGRAPRGTRYRGSGHRGHSRGSLGPPQSTPQSATKGVATRITPTATVTSPTPASRLAQSVTPDHPARQNSAPR